MVPENKQNRRYKYINFTVLKIVAILHNTWLATFIKLLETVSKGLLRIDRRTAVTSSWIASVRQQSKNV
jgi:hypothetical protein